AYAAFSSRSPFIQTFVSNPLANLHLRYSMHLHVSSAQIFFNPAITFNRYMPSSIVDRPTAEYIQAMPSLLLVAFVKYVEAIAQCFGVFAWPLLNLQFVRLRLAQRNFRQLRVLVTQFRSPESPGRWYHL